MSIYERYEKFADKTFDEAADKYLAEFEGACLKRQQYALAHIRPYIGHLRMIDVDNEALEGYKADRIKQAKVGTINKEITTVVTILNRAVRVWRWLPAAPLLERVKGKIRQPYPLTWPEQINMFKRLVGDLQKIALFTVNTGVRREEIFKLKWSDYREIDGVGMFILRETKNTHDRPVILNSIARRVVEQMRDGHFQGKKREGYVFPKMTVNKVLNRAWVDAGLPDDPYIKKGIHNLRHTFGHRLRSCGVEEEDRDLLLGHHSRDLTQHYAASDVPRLGELVERVTVRRDVAILR